MVVRQRPETNEDTASQLDHLIRSAHRGKVPFPRFVERVLLSMRPRQVGRSSAIPRPMRSA